MAAAGRSHRGTDPFLLHVHFNIMPITLAAQFLVGRPTPPYIDLTHVE